MSLFYALALITVLFGLILVAKQALPRAVCAICLAVSLTWLGLLALYHLGEFSDSVILALLVGQSITGIYFLFEKTAHPDLLLFRLPFLISLTLVAYTAITLNLDIWALILTACLWVIWTGIYFYRTRSRFKRLVENIIKCCSGW